MYKRELRYLVALLTIYLSGMAQAAAEIHGVSVQLPGEKKWIIAYEKIDGSQYIREWIPSGSSMEDTDWLISEQKLVLAEKATAERLLRNMMALASKACSDTKWGGDGPKRLMLGQEVTYWGRIMCSHQAGKNYGTFTDQRVLVDGTTAYVVTSELRTAPSDVAGVINFKTREEAESFFKLSETSARFVLESVSLCPATGCPPASPGATPATPEIMSLVTPVTSGQATEAPKAAGTILSFGGTDYFHRWSKNGQNEFTPQGQEDLAQWHDMVTVNVLETVISGDQLAELADRVLANYQNLGVIVRTDFSPSTPQRPAEHLIVAILIDPESAKFLEATFARFVLIDSVGFVIVYSHRFYGVDIATKMDDWLQANGVSVEKTLMSWKGMPDLAALKQLPQSE